MTEALYLSVYSAVSYIICYMIADVMVVPLEKEVFFLLDEKRGMVFTLPLLALLLFIGEISAIATWQRYRRLKEEELRLQEELKQQEFIRKMTIHYIKMSVDALAIYPDIFIVDTCNVTVKRWNCEVNRI